MDKQYLAVNNQEGLLCYKTQPINLRDSFSSLQYFFLKISFFFLNHYLIEHLMRKMFYLNAPPNFSFII